MKTLFKALLPLLLIALLVIVPPAACASSASAAGGRTSDSIAETPQGLILQSFRKPPYSDSYLLPDAPDANNMRAELRPLYRMMSQPREGSVIYLIVPKNGLALCTIALSTADVTYSDILSAEQDILAAVCGDSGTDAELTAGTLFDLPCVRLSLRYNAEDQLPCMLEGLLLPTEDEILELWIAYPDAEKAALSQADITLLESDLIALHEMENSLSFTSDLTLPRYSTPDCDPPQTESFADYAEHYRIELPAGTRVLDALTDEGERTALLDSYRLRNGEDCEPLLSDLQSSIETGGTAYFLPDGVSIAQVFVFSAGGNADLNSIADGLEVSEANLQQLYDAAILFSRYQLNADGLPFCMGTFLLRSGDTSWVADCLIGTDSGTFYEVDLYTPVGSDTTRNTLLWLFEHRFTFPTLYDGTDR